MTDLQRLDLELSEIRAELATLGAADEPDTARIDELTGRVPVLEKRRQALMLSAPDGETTETTPEDRERLELRSAASLGAFMRAGGQPKPGSPEYDYGQACGVPADGLPLDLWAAPETRVDVATTAPSKVGVNMQAVVPAVFPSSIAPRLGVAMPNVASGTHAVPRVTTNLTAGMVTKGAAEDSTAAALTVETATPARLSARLTVQEEDVAAIGTETFEAALRDNLSMALSAELDNQIINGSGTAPNVSGLLHQTDEPHRSDGGGEV